MVTKPITIITRWDRFKRLTVWHPLNTDPEDDERAGPRFWYPMYDIIAFCLGLTAFLYGSPLLNKLFPGWFSDVVGIVIMAAATFCLIGVVFPKVNTLELIGKMVIIFMVGGYAGTLVFFFPTGPNWFVGIILTMSIWLLGPRVTKLLIQVTRVRRAWRDRRKELKI